MDNISFVACKDEEYKCSYDAYTICLPQDKLCDETEDCPEGDDEDDCGMQHMTCILFND